MDTIKGLALIGTFIGVLIIFAMWVSLWESVWQASVEPTRGAIYETRLNRLGPSPCLRSSWMWWRSRGLSKNRDGRIWGRTFGGGHRVWFRFICLSETRPITCGAVTSRSDPVINSRRATVVDCLPGHDDMDLLFEGRSGSILLATRVLPSLLAGIALRFSTNSARSIDRKSPAPTQGM